MVSTGNYGTVYSTVGYNPEYSIVPNTADRSSAVQKVLSINDEGGGCFPFSKDIYSMDQIQCRKSDFLPKEYHNQHDDDD